MRATSCPNTAVARRRGLGTLVFILAIGLGLWPAPGTVRAAGFVNNDQSPTATGLAGAVVARPDDASAIYYNPAGLAFQSGLSVLAGITLINLQQSVTDPSGGVYNSQGGHFVVPTIFASARVTDRIAFGVGVFTNTALNANWENTADTRLFPGRYKALDVNIQSITINPSVALRLIPEISIGAGFDVELGSLELVRALALGDVDGRIALSGSAVGFGFNFGALARLLDGRLNFGLAFRSAITMSFNNMQLGATAPPGIAFTFPYTQGATDVSTPHTIDVGVAGKPIKWLTISADFISSLFSDTHDQRLELSNAMGQTQVTDTPRNWHDAYSGRLGLEADLGAAFLENSKLWPKVRVGFGYDQSPVPAETIDTSSPDSDRFLVSAGLSLGYRGIGSVDVGYTATIFRSRMSENPDLALTYNSMIHVFSAAINLQLERLFGKRSPAFAGRQLERSPQPIEETPPDAP